MQLVRDEAVIGDVASFYLPHVEQANELAPEVRVVCLKRPREEVVESFCRWLDKVHPLPTNHWAKRPAAGWYHEPIYTRMFPQYDTQDRAEGIRRYWSEYYERAESLVTRFPQNVCIFDSQQSLGTEDGQRKLLSFCGFARDEQILSLDIHLNQGESAPQRRAPVDDSLDPFDPRRCVVLVPFYGHIEQSCEIALKELERRGYPVRRVGGYAAIDQARNKMATDALLDGFEETMWIDADTGFEPDDIGRLRKHGLPIVTGVCPKKGKQELALHVLPGTKRMVFGKHGGLMEIKYAGTGFLYVRREVYERLQCELELPVCNERFPRPVVPFFHPLIFEDAEGPWYLGEDWSFCERARQCGFQIMADTVIRLWHIGNYRYGWEDAGNKMQRYSDFTLNLPGRKDLKAGPQDDDETPSGLPSERRNDDRNGNTWKLAELEALRNSFPWPKEPSAVGASLAECGLDERLKLMLSRAISSRVRVIAVLGAGAGCSVRFLADQKPQAAIIAVDQWPDNTNRSEIENGQQFSQLFDAFLINCNDYRHRALPLRMTNAEALNILAARHILPDVIYFDSSDDSQSLESNLELSIGLFPRTTVYGNDWNTPSVNTAVTRVAARHGLRVKDNTRGWQLKGLATGHAIIVQ